MSYPPQQGGLPYDGQNELRSYTASWLGTSSKCHIELEYYLAIHDLCWSRIGLECKLFGTSTKVFNITIRPYNEVEFGLIVQALFTIWWIFTITAAYQVWYPAACKQRPAGNMPASSARCDNSRFVVIVIFLLFTYYWVSQTIFTWVHVTTSGVFASYYFLEGTEQGVPPSPIIQSAKRASTTSLGSVCLGSLLVALLQTIRALLRMAAQETDNPFGAFCAACAEVIIGCIEGLLQYFNFYAYTQVAIYGKSFWQAAKDTWELIKDRGVEAIINDNLIGNVVLIGSILVGMLTALFGYLYTIIIHPSFNRDGGFTALIIVLSFIIGFQMLSVIGSVILSGTATTFVCLAEDPRALERTKLNLYRAVHNRDLPEFCTGITCITLV
ncbi:5610_t:CDS:2 [Acaulospora morrowiae]|uniref:Protein PNS1 n=1 Tax=Acaulospora morrowiae TaxID=94023 RepID=A0A9N9BLH4_9GLOM|nr:5610_t:CDS:2 [Acaulospora morrowiae]